MKTTHKYAISNLWTVEMGVKTMVFLGYIYLTYTQTKIKVWLILADLAISFMIVLLMGRQAHWF